MRSFILFLQPATRKRDTNDYLPRSSNPPFLPYSLREMDIELMRRLSPRVNVIPVIGKADSLTPRELKAFKKRVC